MPMVARTTSLALADTLPEVAGELAEPLLPRWEVAENDSGTASPCHSVATAQALLGLPPSLMEIDVLGVVPTTPAQISELSCAGSDDWHSVHAVTPPPVTKELPPEVLSWHMTMTLPVAGN